MGEVVIRPAIEQDLPIISGSWLKSYADSDEALLCTPRDEEHTRICMQCGAATRVLAPGHTYWPGQKWVIARLLLLNGALVVPAEDSDAMIDGWMCRDPKANILHYMYVRHSARGRGIAKELVGSFAPGDILYHHRSRGLEGRRIPKRFKHDHYQLLRSLVA